jgi:hypothetical protein
MPPEKNRASMIDSSEVTPLPANPQFLHTINPPFDMNKHPPSNKIFHKFANSMYLSTQDTPWYDG